MKLSLFRSSNQTGESRVEHSLAEVNQRILSNLLWAACFLGLPAYLSVALPAIRERNWVLLAPYTAAYAWIWLITLVRRTPTNLRAGSVLALTYALGLLNLWNFGLRLDGPIFLLVLVVLSTYLYGFWGCILSLSLDLETLIVLNGLAATGQIASPALLQSISNGNSTWWVQAGLTFLLLAGILAYMVYSLRTLIQDRLLQEKRIAREVESEQLELRSQVEQHTRDLERRLVQLRTAAEISRALSAVLDTEQLLQQVVDLVCERFNLYYAGVFLLDANGEYAVLRAGTGEAAAKMLAYGHKLAVGGNSMIGASIAQRQARIALDAGQEAVRFENPFLPETRSELALPILSGGRVLGAMTFQSSRPADFDENDLTVLQSVADSLATAIENARLFAQVQSSLEEIRSLHRQYLSQAWSQLPFRQDELYYSTGNNPSQEDEAGALLEVPLLLRDQVIGRLTLESTGADWTAEEKRLVEAVSAQAALALENARLLEETQRRVEQERIGIEITNKIWSSTDPDTILRTAVQDLSKALQASAGLIKLEINE